MTDVTPPPAPQAPATVAAASTDIVPAGRKSRGPGIASLLIAIVAVIADIAVVIFAISSLVSVVSGFDPSNFELSSLGGLGAVALLGVITFFGGFVLAGLALLLGIIAIATNRGRVPGVFGVILSILVLITHGSVAGAIANSGEAISGIFPS